MKSIARSHLPFTATLGLLAILVITSVLFSATPAAAQGETNEPPAQPTGLTGNVAHDQVSLSWDDPQDDTITGYQILRRNKAVDDPGVFHVHVESTGSAATSHTDSDVAAETRYVYRIKARNAAGLSPRSGYFNADTPAAPPPPEPESQDPPAQPTGLTGDVAHDSVTLSWNDPGDDTITGYRILRRNKAVDDPGVFHIHVSSTGSAETSYTDSDVEPEQRYVYRIRALNAQGESPRSGYTNADTPAAPASPEQQVPSAPTGLDAVASHDSVTLSWTDPEDASITGYLILRGPDADNLATIVEDTGNAEVSYTDETVEPDTTYVYAIKALNDDGASPESTYTDADTPAAPVPAAPTNLFTAASHNQVLLNWDDPDDDSITGYRILRGPDPGSLTVIVENTGSASISHTDLVVEPETAYVYAVRAINGGGISARSVPIAVTTPAAPQPVPQDGDLITARQLSGTSPPTLPSGPLARGLDVKSVAGAKLGAPVTGSDSDATDILTHALTGTDAASFSIDPTSGQITLASGVTLNYLAQRSYTFEVTLHDGNDNGGTADTTVDDMVTVNVAVNGPWNIVAGADTVTPWGLASTDDTFYVLSNGSLTTESQKIYAFDRTMNNEYSSTKDITLGAEANGAVGLWTDGMTMWTVDSATIAPRAYTISNGMRNSSLEFAFANPPQNTGGVTSDGTTMYVLSLYNDNVYRYSFDGTRHGFIQAPAAQRDARAIALDRDALFVADDGDDKLYAHAADDGERLETRDLNLSSDNGDARGLWMDKPHAWVADSDGTVYTYRLPINLPPAFETGPLTRSVDEGAGEDAPVDEPVTATDPDGDTLTYSLGGADAASFDIVSDTGQITVAAGVTLDYAVRASYTVTVSVRDSKDADGVADTTDDDTVTVVINLNNVDEPGVVTVTPTPAQVDRAMTATVADPDGSVTNATWAWDRYDGSDYTSLLAGSRTSGYTPVAADVGNTLRVTASYDDAQGAGKTAEALTCMVDAVPDNPRSINLHCDNGSARGLWSDRTTIWVVDSGDDKLYAYTLADGTRDSTREFILDSQNDLPIGIWSNGTTIWVADNRDDKLYAYTLAGGTYDSGKDITLDSMNGNPRGLWSDRTTIWVADSQDDKLYAYTLADGTSDSAKDVSLGSPALAPNGLWSDGTTAWVSDFSRRRVLAYPLAGGDFIPGKEVDLSGTTFEDMEGTWSDGDTIWVGDFAAAILYAFKLPTNTKPELPESPQTRALDENSVTGAPVGEPVAATDAENDALTYGLENTSDTGTDADHFTIDANGQVSVSALPASTGFDFETKSSYEMIVTVHDGGDIGSDPDTAEDDRVELTINLNNLDEAGTVELDAQQPQAASPLMATLTDPDGAVSAVTWQWAKSPTSGGTFTNIPGATSSAYTPVANDVNSFLRVTASYTDPLGPGKSASAVSANAVQAEPSTNVAPQYPDGPLERSVDERAEAGVNVGAPVTATDPDGDILSYSLDETDADAAFFEIDGSSGQITVRTGVTLGSFISRSSYAVDVTAADPSSLTDTVRVNISVNNIDEEGVVTLSSTEPRVSRRLRATLGDTDGGVTGTTWQWAWSATADGSFTNIPGADSADYTPTDTDEGRFLRATASYDDAQGAGKSASAVTDNAVAEAMVTNTDPVWPAGQLVRRINENSPAGSDVGPPVSTTDAEGNILAYGLGGVDAGSFDIDSATGQMTLRSGVDLDYETGRRSYSVEVSVSDGMDPFENPDAAVDATVEVTVEVVDVEEEGVVTLSSLAPRATIEVTASLEDPDGGVSSVTWRWDRSRDGVTGWTEVGNRTAAYTPVLEDDGHYLRARAEYNDRLGTGKSAEAVTLSPVSEDLPANKGTYGSVEIGGSMSSNFKDRLDEDWMRVAMVQGLAYRISLHWGTPPEYQSLSTRPYIAGVYKDAGVAGEFIDATNANTRSGWVTQNWVHFRPTRTADYYVAVKPYSCCEFTRPDEARDYTLEVADVTGEVDADDFWGVTTLTLTLNDENDRNEASFEGVIGTHGDTDSFRIDARGAFLYSIQVKPEKDFFTCIRGIYRVDSLGNLTQIEGSGHCLSPYSKESRNIKFFGNDDSDNNDDFVVVVGANEGTGRYSVKVREQPVANQPPPDDFFEDDDEFGGDPP